MKIALDTETTGVDFHHGAKPFIVTICDEKLQTTLYEWDVNPETREPIYNEDDLWEIDSLLNESEEVVLHNPKFDFKALQSSWPHSEWEFSWEKVRDTLLASHLLASGEPHDLTTLSLIHLGLNVKPWEDAIEEATKDALRVVHDKYPTWMVANKKLPCMPSAKDKVWKFDMWVPRAVATAEGYPDDHPWYRLCSEYANVDSSCTIQLYQEQVKLIKERDLWEIYLERLKLLPIVYRMESRGITADQKRLDELYDDYTQEYEDAGEVCTSIARDGYKYELTLPKASANNSLKEFVFDHLKLPVVKKTKKGAPSIDKGVKQEWIDTLEHTSDQHRFVTNLELRGKRATSLSYMDSYRKFWLDHFSGGTTKVLYSSLNPTGTATLRWSSQNPNQQQISKLQDAHGKNLRYAFGPAKGREWWALDYDNLELRIPGYECREPAMMELFENPNDPPFFGSYHMLIASILHEEEWKRILKEVGQNEVAETFKKRNPLKYQWTKNGNFADMYGAVEKDDGWGTADRAYHVQGAQRIIKKRLTKKAKLNDDWIKFAQQNGYVETMPDLKVCPERGYPLQCSRTAWGKILPTVPLNYHVQSTACWVIMKAMIKCQDYLDSHPDFDAFMTMQVHDEIVFDLPYRPNKGNLPKIRKIRSLMESCGDDIGVPLTCGVDYHPNNWSVSE